MSLKSYFLNLARYNLWATHKLLQEHVAALSEDEYRRDCGLFFKSMHGTLNHIMVSEHLIWRRRFAEGVSPMLKLDDEIHTDRKQLTAALEEGAAQWQPLIESWPESRFESMLSYTSTKSVATTLPFAVTLGHVFNHGTHHRGQITAAITAMGKTCPELDLVRMLQAENSNR
jgi:uncharacterized damage-inducible protein DinB